MEQNKPEIIECKGTSYEIGRQYGETAKENILKSLDFMFTSLANGLFFQAPKDEVIRVSNKYLGNVRRFDPYAIQWVEGIADGSGISFEESFALKCYLEIAMQYPQIAGMCTSFALTGSATEKGVTMLGQNIDWHPDTVIDLLRITHDNGLEQLALCFLGNPTYYLNSEGFGSCANLTIAPTGPITTHIPYTFYLFKAMRQHTIGKAMEVLSNTSRGLAYFHLADKNGKMMGVESIYDDYTIINPEKDMLVHANHYETDKYKKLDLAREYIQDSFGRRDRLSELIAGSFGSITHEKMMGFLSDHKNHPDSVCSHVDETKPREMASMSKASFIMIPEELKMYIAFGPPCENKYWEYSL
jgi:isopenicillin-N N-acyltransferase like protein